MNPISFPQPKILFQIASLLPFVVKHTARLLSTVPPGCYRNFGDAVFAEKTESKCLGRDNKPIYEEMRWIKLN
jgi:hypothetical protein